MTYNKTIMFLVLFLMTLASAFALDIAIQDQTTEIIDLKMTRVLASINLSQNYAIYDDVINISSGTVPVVGNTICLKENTFFYQGQIVSVTSLGGSTYQVLLDTPLDSNYTTGGLFTLRDGNFARDGSTTDLVYVLTPNGLNDSVEWDITRVLLACRGTGVGVANDKPDLGDFFVTSALTNGVVFRKVDGTTKNIFTVKDNFDITAEAYDLNIYDASRGGLYAVGVRRTFNGFDKNGVVIRLAAISNDTFQLIVRDDLSEMEKCVAIVQGHAVDNEPSQSTIPGGASMSGSLLYPLVVMLGVGIVAALLVFIAFSLSDDHKYAKLILLASVMIMLLYVPKSGIDMSKNCVVVLANESSVSGATEYNYEEQCFETTDTTAKSFFKSVNRIFYVMTIYCFLYALYIMTNGFKKIAEFIQKSIK